MQAFFTVFIRIPIFTVEELYFINENRQARKVEKLYRLVDVNNNMEATKLRRFTNGRSKKKKCATDYNNYRVPLNESGESNKVLVYLVFSSLCTKHGKFCVTVCKIHFICVTAHL